MKKREIQVVAAVIEFGGEILCVQRGANKFDYIAFKWEFPGGKIESGESESEALSREISEELELKVEVREKLMTVNHEYPDFHLIMHAYHCGAPDKNLSLTEHIAQKWKSKTDLGDLDWAAADIPIVKQLEGNG